MSFEYKIIWKGSPDSFEITIDPEMHVNLSVKTFSSEKIKSFLSDCKEISLSDEIKETVIKPRKNYRIKLPDAIIAASALANKIPLITADKGFCQISELCLELIVPVLGQ